MAPLFCDTPKLLFKGNENITSRELYDALNLSKPYFFEFYKEEPSIEYKNIEIIQDALREFYRSRGFYHAKVLHVKEEGRITITVTENSPVIIKSITYISPVDISEKIGMREGDIFDAEIFSQSKKEIRMCCGERGFCNASVDAKAYIDIENLLAYLTYEVEPKETCRFGDVDIKEVKDIDADIIGSLMYIKEGDTFSTAKIAKTYENLYGYEGVSKAVINTRNRDGSTVDSTVIVTPNEKPIRLKTGIGASSDEGAMLLLGVKHRNFTGNLKTLGAETRLTQVKRTVGAGFDMPLLHRDFFGFDIGWEDEEFIAFKESRLFGNLYVRHDLFEHSFKESIVYDKTKSYDIDDGAIVQDPSVGLVSLKLEWRYDTRDKRLEPSKGYFLNSMLMGSIKGGVSDATYYKFKLGGGYILPIYDRIAAIRASYGTLEIKEGHIPSSYRYFAGGMQSNRAYGYRKLGPADDYNNPVGSDSILEVTAELRFGIYKEFRGVVFSDTTYLGNDSTPNYSNGYHSVGLGVRYKTPVGPLAIDIGFDVDRPLEQYAVHFHIGELF